MMTPPARFVAAVSSASTAILTTITFALALYAIPMAGPYCPFENECIQYPYVDSISHRFPRDYLWMIFAIPQLIVYLIMMVSLQSLAPAENKVYGTIALVFATIATTILVSDYFVQLSVIQPSILAAETGSGLALLTMYNDKGVFIALEEVGYIFMSASFLALAPVIPNIILRLLLVLAFVSTVLTLIYYVVIYGWKRSYRFEVAVICIDWITLIGCGALLARDLLHVAADNSNKKNEKLD
jgi:hypothetical protein